MRSLTVLGIVLVLLGGGLAATSSSKNIAGISRGQSHNTPADTDASGGSRTAPENNTSPPTQIANRASCPAIKGTDYFSALERTWYLDNCVSP